jgi:hypothetical protein
MIDQSGEVSDFVRTRREIFTSHLRHGLVGVKRKYFRESGLADADEARRNEADVRLFWNDEILLCVEVCRKLRRREMKTFLMRRILAHVFSDTG